MIAFVQLWQGGEGWAMSDQLGILGWKKTQIQRFQALWEGFLTMATIQKTSRRGLFPTFGRSGLLISSRQWWRREGGSLTFLFCAIVVLLRFDSSSEVPTQHPPSVVMKLDVEGRFVGSKFRLAFILSYCHPFIREALKKIVFFRNNS